MRIWLVDSWSDKTKGRELNLDTITARDIVPLGPNALRETKTVRRLLAVLADHGWLVALPPRIEIGGVVTRKAYRIVRG